MKRTLWVVLAVAFLTLGGSAFALDVNKLSQAASTYATVSEWMNMIMHPGMPKPWTNPQLSYKMKELSDAQKVITTEINSIETMEEIAKAQAVANSFKMCEGVYRDVGVQLDMMLREREKFIQMHQ